ncbi:unnamed protein product, partial [Scytosiphon promiscuus]
ISLCSLFGYPVEQEGIVQAERQLEDRVQALGAQQLETWTVEVTYKLKQKKKRAAITEMRHGVNISAPFVGMKMEDSAEYPFSKQQYCIRRSDDGSRVMVVQEMAEGSKGATSLTEGKLIHVLEGQEGVNGIAGASAGLVTKLKARIEGNVYKLGDFMVRTGKVRKGAVYRGLAMEVEYLPSCRVADGLAMINGLILSVDEDGLFRPSSDLSGDSETFGTTQQFSPKHTALQTTDLFNKVFA